MNKLKKLIRTLFVFLMVCVFVSNFNQVKADVVCTPQKGTYIQFGHYNGVPIIWRVLDVNENGLLLFSDKIISIKTFDAAESGKFDSAYVNYRDFEEPTKQNYNGIGSNVWENSNLREWLNSDSQIVKYSTQPPTNEAVVKGYNDYDKEVGFLTNFTQTEKSAIREVQNETEVFDWNIKGISDTKDITKDKVFLLSYDEFVKYFKNREQSYPELTEQAAKKSEIDVQYDSKSENNWWYWLRSPSTYYMGFTDMVNSYGYAYDCDANPDGGDGGVRPALYLKSENLIFSGEGTINKPYIVDALKVSNSNKILKYISSNKSTITISKGKSYINKIYGIYNDKTKEDFTNKVVFKSSNNKIVIVLKNGYIKGLTKGNVTITVQYKTMKCSYKVIVT